MQVYDDEEIGFFDALLGLVTQPAETIQVLLTRRRPRYVSLLLLTVALTFFGPYLFYMFKYGTASYRPEVIYGLLVLFTIAFLVFVVLESVLLLLMGMDISLRQIFAAVAYSLSPLIAVFLLIYLFNYLSVGNISITGLLVNPKSVLSDNFMKIFPYAMIIAEANVLIVFMYSLKVLGGLHLPTAIIITAFSMVPLAIAIYIGLHFAEQATPGSEEAFLSLLSAPLTLLSRFY